MGGIIPAVAATGQTVYAQIRNAATGQIANGSGFESYNQAHWANYVNAQSEQAGSGFYSCGFPGYIPAGRYVCTSYIQINQGGPASGDTPIYDTFIDWDGGSIINLGSALNVGQINGSATAAVNLALACLNYVPGTVAAGTLTTSQMTTNLTSDNANAYAGRVLYFATGINAGRVVLITAYVVTGGKLTFVAYNNLPLGSAPSAGDVFLIV